MRDQINISVHLKDEESIRRRKNANFNLKKCICTLYLGCVPFGEILDLKTAFVFLSANPNPGF